MLCNGMLGLLSAQSRAIRIMMVVIQKIQSYPQYDSGSRIFKLKQYFCGKFRQTAPLDGLERDVAVDVIAPELLDGHGQTIAFL